MVAGLLLLCRQLSSWEPLSDVLSTIRGNSILRCELSRVLQPVLLSLYVLKLIPGFCARLMN